jgi:hypothetical protein
MRQRLAAERARLELRSVEEAHAELDRKAKATAKERRREARRKIEASEAAVRVRENIEHRAEEERRERERREIARQERQAQRRDGIQKVKRHVIDWWWSGLDCDQELKGRALRLIERKLETLPVEDLPESELITIATGIRDALFREAERRERAAKKRVSDRQKLIEHGRSYAERELRAVDSLDFSERWRVQRLVESELETIEGDETCSEVEDLVESILEDEDLGWEEDQGDDDDV